MPDEPSRGATPTAGAGAAASSVLPSMGRAADPRASVSALLIVRNGRRWLAECLDGIAAQTVPPDRLLIVDVASTDTTVAMAQAHSGVRQAIPEVTILRIDDPVPIGRAIDLGVEHLGAPSRPAREHTPRNGSASAAARSHEWLWVLHGNSRPSPSTLARLLDAVQKSSSAGVAGPKIVDWDDPRLLVSLGVQATRAGRRINSPEPGEADQGQHDQRTDVLAVSTNGMLLRRDVHTDLRGFDRSFEQEGADLDLGGAHSSRDTGSSSCRRPTLRESCAGEDEHGAGPDETRTVGLVRERPTDRAGARLGKWPWPGARSSLCPCCRCGPCSGAWRRGPPPSRETAASSVSRAGRRHRRPAPGIDPRSALAGPAYEAARSRRPRTVFVPRRSSSAPPWTTSRTS